MASSKQSPRYSATRLETTCVTDKPRCFRDSSRLGQCAVLLLNLVDVGTADTRGPARQSLAPQHMLSNLRLPVMCSLISHSDCGAEAHTLRLEIAQRDQEIARSPPCIFMWGEEACDGLLRDRGSHAHCLGMGGQESASRQSSSIRLAGTGGKVRHHECILNAVCPISYT